MMASRSEEGRLAGLGWLDAEVSRLNVSHLMRTATPMDGTIFRSTKRQFLKECVLLVFTFYSYCIKPKHASTILSRTFYGGYFVSAVAKDNIFGTQFHPEAISGALNYCEISRRCPSVKT